MNRNTVSGQCRNCTKHLFKEMRYKTKTKVIDFCDATGCRIYQSNKKKCSMFQTSNQLQLPFKPDFSYRGFVIEPHRNGGFVATNNDGKWLVEANDIELCKDWVDLYLDR